MAKSGLSALEDRSVTEAALWLVRLSAADVSDVLIDEYRAWLSRSVENRRAMSRVRHIWMKLEGVRGRFVPRGDRDAGPPTQVASERD